MAYNLSSPKSILEPVVLDDLPGWFERELIQVPDQPFRLVLQSVAANLDAFVHWACESLLLWPGCDRIPFADQRQKYHSYPSHIRQDAKAKRITLDSRPNGPAIAAFHIAGGNRPPRFGSSNSWSIHHLYSGKFPFLERGRTMHAAKNGTHFTQSAGLVAIHPIADAVVDEFPFATWLLRAHAFNRFGYDPDGVFSPVRDEFGFVPGRECRVISQPTTLA